MTHAPAFFVLPSLSCPASCSYCFGPRTGAAMSETTFDRCLGFIGRTLEELGRDDPELCFHGGEPLAAGTPFFRRALPEVRRRFPGARISIQSNLWLLDDELAALFASHAVAVGTSLDGPEEITDAGRGPGYHALTMRGIRRLRAHGVEPGVIATFTPASRERWREVLDFFRREGLGFAVHASVPAMPGAPGAHHLDPQAHGELLVDLFEAYLPLRRDVSIATLDQLARSVVRGEGQVCSFQDCLGRFVAIGPGGDLYPCQRFVPDPAYRLGDVAEEPSFASLWATPAARRLGEWRAAALAACGDCPHVRSCRGGCPFQGMAGEGDAATGGAAAGRDPHCVAYRRVFDWVHARLMAEMVTEENVEALAREGPGEGGLALVRRGALAEVAADRAPVDVAAGARRLVAAVELARGPDRDAAASRLARLGVVESVPEGAVLLDRLTARLAAGRRQRNRLYLSVTGRCDLACTHCYRGPRLSEPSSRQSLPAEAIVRLVGEARTLGFAAVVVTGGEPFLHPEWPAVADALARLRSDLAPTRLVLRTSLPRLPDEAVVSAFDLVAVSVDGDEAEHDGRRGAGSFARTLAGVERLVALRHGRRRAARIALAATLDARGFETGQAEKVRDLAARLGVDARVRSVLPLGCASALPGPGRPAEDEPDPATAERFVREGYEPRASCGLGQNLAIAPDGAAYPCHARERPGAGLGDVLAMGLGGVLSGAPFSRLAEHSVDTRRVCRDCEDRYLCGGSCRAFVPEPERDDPDAPPTSCGPARGLGQLARLSALRALGIEEEGGGLA